VGQEREQGQGLYISARWLIDGSAGTAVEGAAVYVREGRIVAAGSVQEVGPPPEGAIVAEYPRGAILPGLIDAHVHLTMRRGETSVEHAHLVSDAVALLRGVQAAGQIVAAGVTTVRDCGARGRVAQDLRDGVRDGFIAGPRILASGPPITTTSGHLWALGYEADTADEGQRAVRRLVKEEADFIKVCATGGGMTPGSNVGRAQYPVEDLRAIADDAHRLGRHVAAHAHGTEGLARAVSAGIDTIEHVSWLDTSGRGQAFDEGVAREMASRGTFANIASSPPRSLVEGGRPLPDASVEGPGAPGGAAEPELPTSGDLSYLAQALVEVGGFPTMDVLRMVTAVPARAIGWGDRLGLVQEGKLADLLVVQGNPARDIRALHRVLAVYQEGRNVAKGGAG
jgi:imidazolonepropionase-like amidohydrolase